MDCGFRIVEWGQGSGLIFGQAPSVPRKALAENLDLTPSASRNVSNTCSFLPTATAYCRYSYLLLPTAAAYCLLSSLVARPSTLVPHTHYTNFQRRRLSELATPRVAGRPLSVLPSVEHVVTL